MASAKDVRVLERSTSVALKDVADPGLQATLMSFDKDGSGTVDLVELRAAAEAMRRTQAQGQLLKKIVLVLAVLILAMVGINAGLTFAVIEATRETEVSEGNLLEKGTDMPVATAAARQEVSVFGLLGLAHEELTSLEELTLPMGEGHVVTYSVSGELNPGPDPPAGPGGRPGPPQGRRRSPQLPREMGARARSGEYGTDVRIVKVIRVETYESLDASTNTQVILWTALGEKIVITAQGWEVRDRDGRLVGNATAYDPTADQEPKRRKLNQAKPTPDFAAWRPQIFRPPVFVPPKNPSVLWPGQHLRQPSWLKGSQGTASIGGKTKKPAAATAAKACPSASEALSGEAGRGYRGRQTKTRSGKDCMKWTVQKPHRHTRTPAAYPNLGLGDHNYCWNPDKADTIWCYTTDSSTRWEYCDPLVSSAASDSDAQKDAQREIDALKAEVEEWRTKARDAETGKGQCTDDMMLVEDELDEVKQDLSEAREMVKDLEKKLLETETREMGKDALYLDLVQETNELRSQVYDLRDELEECRDGCSESATILANAAAACLEEQKAMKVQISGLQNSTAKWKSEAESCPGHPAPGTEGSCIDSQLDDLCPKRFRDLEDRCSLNKDEKSCLKQIAPGGAQLGPAPGLGACFWDSSDEDMVNGTIWGTCKRKKPGVIWNAAQAAKTCPSCPVCKTCPACPTCPECQRCSTQSFHDVMCDYRTRKRGKQSMSTYCPWGWQYFSVDCPWNMKYSPTGHPRDGGPVCTKAW